MPSGISKVVFFISLLSHIYGSMPSDCSMRVLQFSSARGLMAKQKSSVRVTQSEFRKHYFGAFVDNPPSIPPLLEKAIDTEGMWSRAVLSVQRLQTLPIATG